MMNHLLIHSAVWESSIASVLVNPEEARHVLSRVRIDITSHGNTLSVQGSQRSDAGRMYFRAGISRVDSELTVPDFHEGDILEFNGHSYHMTGIRPVYDGKGVHHLEATLV